MSKKQQNWLVRTMAQLAEASKAFGKDTGCITLIAALALVAVILGRDEYVVLGFATFFAVLVPLCRYFKLIR